MLRGLPLTVTMTPPTSFWIKNISPPDELLITIALCEPSSMSNVAPAVAGSLESAPRCSRARGTALPMPISGVSMS
jgi:hypothetical protein